VTDANYQIAHSAVLFEILRKRDFNSKTEREFGVFRGIPLQADFLQKGVLKCTSKHYPWSIVTNDFSFSKKSSSCSHSSSLYFCSYFCISLSLFVSLCLSLSAVVQVLATSQQELQVEAMKGPTIRNNLLISSVCLLSLVVRGVSRVLVRAGGMTR